MTIADLGRAVAAWDHTAQLLAMLANTVRDPKRRPSPFAASDFHPLRKKQADEDDGPGDLELARKALEQCHHLRQAR